MSKIYKAEELTSALRLVSAIDAVVNRNHTDEEPLMFIPKNKKYIEILGRRIDTSEDINSFEDFCDWLTHIKDMEEENKNLKKEIDEYENKRARLIDYLTERIEEEKVERTHYLGMEFTTIREQIYSNILDIVEEKDEQD